MWVTKVPSLCSVGPSHTAYENLGKVPYLWERSWPTVRSNIGTFLLVGHVYVNFLHHQMTSSVGLSVCKYFTFFRSMEALPYVLKDNIGTLKSSQKRDHLLCTASSSTRNPESVSVLPF